MRSIPDTSATQPRANIDRIPLLVRLVATGFYSGYSPVASGTAGSCVAVLIYCIPGFNSPWVIIAATVLAFFAGVFTSARVAAIVGDRINPDAQAAKNIFQSGKHMEADPSIVVIDEIAGMWIALLFLPREWPAITAAFVFFRLFDIIKPYPAARLERLPNGWGIMLDDVVAGVYANMATLLFLKIIAVF